MPARWVADRESAGFLKERINLGAGGDGGPCAGAVGLVLRLLTKIHVPLLALASQPVRLGVPPQV